MANRFPLILDTLDGNKIKELPSGDNLNLEGSSIVNVDEIQATGTISAPNILINGQPLQPSRFIELIDTPQSFEDSANALLKVNSTESGIEFASFDDFGDLTVGNILVKGNISTEIDNSISIGSEQFKISEIWSTELRGSLKSYTGEIVFDAITGKINYAAVINAPNKLSEFENDLSFVSQQNLNFLVEQSLANQNIQPSTIKTSILSEDSTLMLDHVNNTLSSAVSFTNILRLSFSSEEPNRFEGNVALADGIGWNPLNNGLQSLVIYLNGVWRSIAIGD
jgi:hypothetical protein